MNNTNLHNTPKVAIIMSVYRSDNLAYLQMAVDSIINQSYHNLVLFIYRDGCVPKNVNEYLSFLTKNPKIKLILNDDNLGLAYALNNLIDVVIQEKSYEYIARMDSDDISRLDRILKQVNYLEHNGNIDVCGTSCREFGASFALPEKHLPQSPEELLDFSITHCPFIHPTVMFRASIFNENIRYPLNTSFTEDMALWFVLLNHNFNFGNLNDILLDYRLNEGTLTRRSGIKKATSEFTIRFKNMFTLKRVNVKNIILIGSRLFFHLLPPYLMKMAYKRSR